MMDFLFKRLPELFTRVIQYYISVKNPRESFSVHIECNDLIIVRQSLSAHPSHDGSFFFNVFPDYSHESVNITFP